MTRLGPGPRVTLSVHLALVVSLTVLGCLLYIGTDPDVPDANIGAGLVLLLLTAAGLPWTVLSWGYGADGGVNTSGEFVLGVLVLGGLASVNLVLHYLLVKLLASRAPS